MADKRKFELSTLRYVPQVVRDLGVDFGLLLTEMKGGQDYADVRFTRDWNQVLCLDPQADLEMLQGLTREVKGQFAQLKERAVLMKWLEDAYSNLVQLSPAKGVLSYDPEAEIEILASMYLERPRLPAKQTTFGRQKIKERMKYEWERVGVDKLVLPVPVAPYTKPGDPFQFDFGYRVGGEIKLFHAVSLKASVDSALLLAARYPKIAPVMSAKTDAALALTAVVDDDLDRGSEAIQFALSAMVEEKIRIAAVAEMPAVAETARRDLRA